MDKNNIDKNNIDIDNNDEGEFVDINLNSPKMETICNTKYLSKIKIKIQQLIFDKLRFTQYSDIKIYQSCDFSFFLDLLFQSHFVCDAKFSHHLNQHINIKMWSWSISSNFFIGAKKSIIYIVNSLKNCLNMYKLYKRLSSKIIRIQKYALLMGEKLIKNINNDDKIIVLKKIYKMYNTIYNIVVEYILAILDNLYFFDNYFTAKEFLENEIKSEMEYIPEIKFISSRRRREILKEKIKIYHNTEKNKFYKLNKN